MTELNPPIDLSLHHPRLNTIAKRNAEKDPIKRQRLTNLVETMAEHDKAPDNRKPLFRKSIADQIERIQQG